MKIELKLYISGNQAVSLRARENLSGLVAECLNGEAQVEVIDIQRQPALAAAARIMATPTLIKAAPEPRRKVIGDLSDKHKALLFLGLPPQEKRR
jgi:circadian clock protein KaiB